MMPTKIVSQNDHPPLTPEHLAKLISSGLTPEQALLTGHRSVNAAEAKQLTGHELPGLLLTYTDPSGKPYQVMTGKWAHKPFYRLRPDWAAARHAQKEHYQDADGAAPKYLSPKDCGNRPYFSPLCDWRRVMRKTSELVLLTEGELKGDAGCAYGFPAIAGAGVSAFVDRNSRGEWMAGSDGSAWDIDDGRGDDDDGQPVARFLPELESFPWKNRPVGIVFDSDLTKNFQSENPWSLYLHMCARGREKVFLSCFRMSWMDLKMAWMIFWPAMAAKPCGSSSNAFGPCKGIATPWPNMAPHPNSRAAPKSWEVAPPTVSLMMVPKPACSKSLSQKPTPRRS
ncbi:MAG: DUF3854 domain-containing protein [Synechococcales cyanobacterium CRU_2_2]|nr:DUF3854 domain-containing protein [Synechococcales cyanobacterium CRU_2_2]